MRNLPDCLAPTATCAGARKTSVLIVEDDWLIALALQDMLESAGYDVVGPASDVATAVDLAKSATYDVAMLDYYLHDLSIHPVLDVVRSKNIPFVLATGLGADAIGVKGVPVLAKPYTSDDVEAVLRKLLSQHVAPSAAKASATCRANMPTQATETASA